MDFQRALTHVKNLAKVSRSDWHSSYLVYKKGSKPNLYLVIVGKRDDGEIVQDESPWRPMQDDLLADDWRLLE